MQVATAAYQASKVPAGARYQARKRQAAWTNNGRIKRALFLKLRTSHYITASGHNNAAVVEFTGKVQRTVQIHQFGLKDRVSKHTQSMQYPQCQLLDFSTNNKQLINKLIIQHLNR